MCDVSFLSYTFSFQEGILTIHYGYILCLLCLHCICQDSLSWGSNDPEQVLSRMQDSCTCTT